MRIPSYFGEEARALDTLDPHTTALVLIDLQRGILPFAGGPHSAARVLATAAALAKRFRALGAPVALVRMGFSDGYPELLRQPTDQPPPVPPGGLPAGWSDLPDELMVSPQDIPITKRHWNAFHGTELDLQLRRRGIATIVLGGIATGFGVESTARAGWELGYTQILAEDAMSAPTAAHHCFSVENILPRLGRVRPTAEILAALA
jgi:nicotinamidase-related amidase